MFELSGSVAVMSPAYPRGLIWPLALMLRPRSLKGFFASKTLAPSVNDDFVLPFLMSSERHALRLPTALQVPVLPAA